MKAEHLQRFSECLARMYEEPVGENPITGILDALDVLMRTDGIAVDELRGVGGRLVSHRHLADRRPELMDARPEVIAQIAHDHPLILHALRHGFCPSLKLSDFVTQRQMRTISLYALNSRKHEWRDQVALLAKTGAGSVSFTMNRDRVFTPEEFLLLQMFQRHVQRALSRCAWFVALPGREQFTLREREVLYWITQGKRDQEIAVIIACAERTVRQHTRAILRKLGVENRAGAISAVLSGRAHSAPAARVGNSP